jgi:hypothetical protein
MDDPGSLDYYNQLQTQSNPALQGQSNYVPPTLDPETQKKWDAYMRVAGSDIHPQGAQGYSPQGLPVSWVPADQELRQTFMGKPDEHQHFGEVIDDPVYGKIQSTYRDPPKPSFSSKYMPLVFGGALAAITGGAAAPFLGPMFSAAMQYGTKGKIDPLSLGMSLGGSYLGGINPALGQAFNIGKAGYAASKGNYAPGLGMAANAGYDYLTG